eukprot:4761883-Amphidinium_carterae.5
MEWSICRLVITIALAIARSAAAIIAAHMTHPFLYTVTVTDLSCCVFCLRQYSACFKSLCAQSVCSGRVRRRSTCGPNPSVSRHRPMCVRQPPDRMVMRPLKAAIRRQVSADFAKHIIERYTSGGTFEIKSGLVHNRPRLLGWVHRAVRDISANDGLRNS